MAVNTGPVYYPFAVVPPTSSSNVFPNDLIIETVYPGIIFDAQEAGSTYSVIREVDGCQWFVLNADFNETTLQWTQEDPTNPNTPAYAMELCANGTWNWLSGIPTLIPGTPVVWRQVYLIDANGSVISTPQIVVASGDPSQQVNVTWNLGGSAQAIARQVNVTDSSSASSSLLDNLEVNSVPKWSVDKNGVLVVGSVPASSIINLFNNPTFTGTSTFDGPVDMESTLHVDGTVTFEGALITNNSGGTNHFGGNTQNDGSLTVDGTLHADGSLIVQSGATIDTLHVTGVSTFDSTVQNDSGGPVVPITSPDSSITIVTVANGYHITESGTGIGDSRTIPGINFVGPTPAPNFGIPGGPATNWNATISATVVMTAPLAAGNVTVTGTGSTGGWNSSNLISNTNQIAFPLMFGGSAHGGDNLVATFTATGGTIDHIDFVFVASRFS